MAYHLARRQDFAPSCPAGGTWWACGYGTYFVGCCARDPCDITCAQGNLYPAAFDPAKYGTFVDATCGTGAKFYTCIAGPTFLGCCKTNPCAKKGICPDGDLEPAILNRDDQRSAYHATGGTSSMRATASATSTPEPSATDDAQTVTKSTAEKKTNIGAIAGGAAGGAFGLAVLIGLLIYYVCHAKKSRRGHAETVGQRLSIATERREKDGVGSPPPPGYYSPDANGNYHQDSSYYQSYGGFQHQQYPQFRPEPQELPIEAVDGVYNPAARGHRRDPSELSGETALASPNINMYTGHQNPQQFEHQSPQQFEQHGQQQFGHESSQLFEHQNSRQQSPQQCEPQEPRTPQDDPAVQTWMAHQSWRPQSTEYSQPTGYPQGLGVQAWRREEQEGSARGR